MRRKWLHRIRNYVENNALVLMYHRVAEPVSDAWDIAVSPSSFERHLQVLEKEANVVPLKELAEAISNGKRKKNSIAITFDDGYADNYLIAKPLLEKYQMPATFFITSGHIGETKEFWWDELEHLILFAESLPQLFSLKVGDSLFEYDLKEEACLTAELRQKHTCWKASKNRPVSLRSDLYLRLYFLFKPLLYQHQQQLLNRIKELAGQSLTERIAYRSMTLEQLQDLSRNSLFSIGAHTQTHLTLAQHEATLQRQEIAENKKFLEQTLNKRVHFLAYPYGDYNSDTKTVAYDLGFDAAFTTREKLIRESSDSFSLGRFQVNNWSQDKFQSKLQYWFKYSK